MLVAVWQQAQRSPSAGPAKSLPGSSNQSSTAAARQRCSSSAAMLYGAASCTASIQSLPRQILGLWPLASSVLLPTCSQSPTHQGLLP